MNSAAQGQRRLLAATAGICLFFSGAAGLIYEIVWMRMLGLVFGHTVYAITMVLAAFMAGLALGASFFGRLIDRRGRPLRVYGTLEAGIGLYALLVPLLFAGAQAVYLRVDLSLSSFTFGFARFALVSLILLIPTTLMGASLPVMTKFFVDRMEGLGRKVGDLYALNTLGAVIGSGAAGFLLLPAIGVRATTGLAAVINLLIGAAALTADRWVPPPRKTDVSTSQVVERVPAGGPPALVTGLVLASIGLSGAAAMVFEISWTRALTLVIGSSIYAFSAMLTTFLLGLALGSFLFARIWGRGRANAVMFGALELAVGLTALVLTPAFERLPDLVLAISARTAPSAASALLTQFALSFLVMIVPTTIFGATFPCAVQICARILPSLGRDTGMVYTVNTTGTILGALLAGFLIVPSLGAQASMVVAAGANAAVGLALIAVSAPARPVWRSAVAVLVALVFVAGVVLLPRWDRGVMAGGVSIYLQRYVFAKDPAALFRTAAASRQLLFYREGVNATVVVERTERMTSLKVDGKVDASNGVDMLTQLMLGHLPLLLHPHAERVLVIGLGSGVTAGAIAQHPTVREIDVVELEPAVVEASSFFARENRDVLRDPRVRLVIGDGRNFVLAATKRYDVISSEPSNPWIAGVASLFSREFYQLARQRLAEGGIMVQWVHGYNLFPEALRMVMNTFRGVFPHSTLWRTIQGDYLLVGTFSPLAVEYGQLEQRISASASLRDDLASLRLELPVDLLPLFVLDEDGLARFADGAAENTDDRPLLEFSAPLALYADTTGENARRLRQARTTELPPITNLPAELLAARRLDFARAYWASGEREEALDQLRKAPPPDPGDIAFQLERAKLLFSLGEIGSAIEELARLSRRRPQDRLITSYLKVGTILRDLQVEETVAQHGRTRFGDPNPAEAHNNLGVFYTRLGIRSREPAFFDLAVDALEAARGIEPQAYPVINNLGNAYFELGRLDEATRAYREVIRLAPREAEARFNLGLVYERKGMLGLAAREFEAAIMLRPGWSLPRMRLAELRGSTAPSTEARQSPHDVPPPREGTGGNLGH